MFSTMLRRLLNFPEKQSTSPRVSISSCDPDEYPLHRAAFDEDLEQLRNAIQCVLASPAIQANTHNENKSSLEKGAAFDRAPGSASSARSGSVRSESRASNVVAEDEQLIAQHPINQLDSAGNTALHIAVWRNSVCA